MYIESKEEAVALVTELRSRMRSIKEVDVAVAPPFIFLPAVLKALKRSTIMVGAQAVSRYHASAHTGDISAAMLKDAGVSFVIVGHSERRAAGESDEIIQKQLAEVGDARLSAILCVGEKERDAAGDYFEVIKAQLASALTNISKKSLSKLVIAYEPVWAIGKSAEEAMKPTEVQETIIFIKKVITDMLGRSAANKIPILYGGSVEEVNAGALLTEGGVNGFLVGHASASVETFIPILKACK